MLIQYKGDGRLVSFIPNSVYEAHKIHDELGDGYAIYDEGDDWYRYGVSFVEENFVEFEEKAEPAENISRAV